MKKMMALALVSLSLSTYAQISPLEDLTANSVSKKTSLKIWDSMKTDTNRHSECFNRAMAWMYDINKEFGVIGKKYIIHYTAKYNQEISSKWGFHIAPMINVDGVDMVFDRGFPQWIDKPITKEKWEDVFLVHGVEELIKIRKEIKEKISKKESKIRTAALDIRLLSRSDAFYWDKKEQLQRKISNYKEQIKEYEDELDYLEVSDADVKEWVSIRINEIEKEKLKLQQQLTSLNTSQKATSDELYKQIRELSILKRKILNDNDLAIDIRCEKITHIEELDYNQFSNYCYMQEVSMYYWGIPQLRLLNYGPGYGLSNLPNEEDLPMSRIEGAAYRMNAFDMDQVWDARAEAFDDYKEQWKKEYRALKRSEEQAKEQERIAKERERARQRDLARRERFERQRERDRARRDARQERFERQLERQRERQNR